MTESHDNETSDQTTAKAVPDYQVSAESREHAGFFDLLRPRYLRAWTWAFIEGWFVSRPYSRLWVAAPFLLVATVGTGFVWWLINAPQDKVVQQYERAIEASVSANDPVKTGLYLRGLTALRPHDQRYRFQLAIHQLENDDNSRAVSNLMELTAGDGYMPARMWLVRQAISPEPLLPMEDEAIEGQLRMILAKEPANVRANQIIADLYLRKGQFKAAEDRLAKIVNEIPALGLPLAKVERLLKRNEEQVERHLMQAETVFQDQLIQNPADVKSRIHRAEALSLRRQFSDAEQLLKEGLAIEDSPELRKSLAEFYAGLARSRLSESVLNRDNARQLFAQALQLDPQNKLLLRQALSWAGRSAFPEQALTPTIQFLIDEASTEPGDRLLLAEALAASGREQQAIQIMTPLAEQNHRLQPVLVRLLKAAGLNAEAQTLTQSILGQPLTADSDDSGKDLFAIVDRAEILNLAGRFSDSIHLLEANTIPNNGATTDAENEFVNRKWNQIYGAACLATFDSKLASETFDSEDEVIGLLDKVLSTNSQPVAVLERLVRLSCTQHAYAKAADQRLTKILAAGVANPLIYNLVGTHALQLNQPSKARRYLERAYSLGRDNPMVLNNLAIALVRDSSADPERAMQIADEALKILPDHPDVLSTRAEIYVALERWEDARRDLEVSLPKRPQSQNSRKLLAMVYDQLGQPELAAEHRRILEQNESDNVADDAE